MLLALVTALSACPPAGSRCPTPFPPFNPAKQFGINGHKLAVTVAQPVASCQPMAGTATVSLIDPNNRPFTAFTSSASAAQGVTNQTTVFTPNLPGTWQLVVTFEPSLGRVQLPIDVADERLQTTRYTAGVPYDPVDCVAQPFMTHRGLVLCELDGGIHTQREGGPDVVIAGTQLVVLGDTVWAQVGGSLTRFTDTGSELRVDATATLGGRPLPDHAFTSETTAVRAFSNGIRDGGPSSAVVRYDCTDGGLTGTPVKAVNTDAFFMRDGTLYRVGRSPMTFDVDVCKAVSGDAGCVKLGAPVLALDEAGLWADLTFSQDGIDVIESPALGAAGARRFVFGDSWAAFPQVLYASDQSAPTRALVDREAVVASKSNEPGPLVVRHVGGEFTVGYYADGEVLGTRGDFLVLKPPGAGRRVSFIRY